MAPCIEWGRTIVLTEQQKIGATHSLLSRLPNLNVLYMTFSHVWVQNTLQFNHLQDLTLKEATDAIVEVCLLQLPLRRFTSHSHKHALGHPIDLKRSVRADLEFLEIRWAWILPRAQAEFGPRQTGLLAAILRAQPNITSAVLEGDYNDIMAAFEGAKPSRLTKVVLGSSRFRQAGENEALIRLPTSLQHLCIDVREQGWYPQDHRDLVTFVENAPSLQTLEFLTYHGTSEDYATSARFWTMERPVCLSRNIVPICRVGPHRFFGNTRRGEIMGSAEELCQQFYEYEMSQYNSHTASSTDSEADLEEPPRLKTLEEIRNHSYVEYEP